MTEKELVELSERNQDRKKLKKKAAPRPWCYDSIGYLEQCIDPFGEDGVKPGKGIAILVRPVTWFRELQARYGSGILDEEIPQSAYLPLHRSAEYVLAALNEPIEEDIDSLLTEVRRLSRPSPGQRRERSESPN